MAENTAEDKPSKFHIDSSHIVTRAANRYGTNINDSDVSIFFGSYTGIETDPHTELHTQIVMPFGEFLDFVEHLVGRYQVLKAMFGDQPLKISNVDPDKVQKAWALLGAPPIGDRDEKHDSE